MYTGLTRDEERILQVIRDARAEGYVPSYREITDAAKLKSTDTVSRYLKSLEQKGIVELPPKGQRRGIRLRLERPPISVPQLGEIKTGTDLLAEENIDGRQLLTRDLVGDGELVMVRVRGDSMAWADLREGDQVVIRRQNMAEEGEIVAAILLANPEPELTLKFFGKRSGRFVLLPANPEYQPIDAEQAAARIVGKAVALFRRI